jgi:homoserine dehydrogenase
MNKKLNIGFFGFGCVGQGLYDIFTKTEFQASIKKICVKNKHKERSIPAHHFTFDKNEILNDSEINLIVEMIDDANEAYNIVKYALTHQKNVVTANKKMLAENLDELVKIQEEYGTSLLYEASACGSIPIIRNLEEYYDNELLRSVSGIFNGSSNYILSKIFQEKLSYQVALQQAQNLGFAETDPTLDVGGFDAKFKLCIITAHAYGLFVHPDEVFNYGIQTLNEYDIRLANEKNAKIKVIAYTGKKGADEVVSFVMPHFIFKKHELYHVENEYNGVIAEAAFADKQVFVGKGAGGHPTGAAVLSDISAMRYEYRYEYKKVAKSGNLHYVRDVNIEVYVRYQKDTELEGLHFQNIFTKHESKDFKYIIGEINLENLYHLRNDLRKRNIFLVSLGIKK